MFIATYSFSKYSKEYTITDAQGVTIITFNHIKYISVYFTQFGKNPRISTDSSSSQFPIVTVRDIWPVREIQPYIFSTVFTVAFCSCFETFESISGIVLDYWSEVNSDSTIGDMGICWLSCLLFSNLLMAVGVFKPPGLLWSNKKMFEKLTWLFLFVCICGFAFWGAFYQVTKSLFVIPIGMLLFPFLATIIVLVMKFYDHFIIKNLKLRGKDENFFVYITNEELDNFYFYFLIYLITASLAVSLSGYYTYVTTLLGAMIFLVVVIIVEIFKKTKL